MSIMMRARAIAVLSLMLAIIARADAPSTDSPQTIFDNRGLIQSDVWLVLPYESGVHDGVGQAKQKADSVHVETTSRRDLRFEIQGDKHTIESLLDNLIDADNQINNAIATRRQMSKDDPHYGQLIDLYNAALKSRDAASRQIEDAQKDEDNAQKQLGEVPDARPEYANLIMDTATQAESVAKAYAALAQDSQLTQAIASANTTASPALKLGPSPIFAADLDFLRKAVKDVIDSPIPVRRGDNNELYVQAVLNGTVTQEMMWDSGADLISLSAETARQLGIHPTDHDPEIEMGMAGGQTVKVREVILDSVRLGGFTVKNVPCVVLPDLPHGHADDLLGDTFQTHFISRMDQRTQQLQLTPADSSVLVGAIPHDLH
jgi:clan AA aspartic protease (TIGR02281 family)